jgi:hypothetical protein
MMKSKLTLAALMVAGAFGAAFAQGEGPKSSDANPPAAVRQQPGATNPAPVQGAGAPAARPDMKSSDVGLPGGAGANTPGTTRAGTGKGTTGTRQQGGSGNE